MTKITDRLSQVLAILYLESSLVILNYFHYVPNLFNVADKRL